MEAQLCCEPRTVQVVRIMSTTTSAGPFKSLGRIGQASELAALFFEDWELGRGSFEVRNDHGPLCQKMRDACWDSSESLCSPCSL